ncbi:MAG TPA: methyltransferase domain-containing protein [Thermomicrobiaceae bacterium]|nr:methyltransferase domain-containing protein [Thermomicrobiaceae bacterium]
MVVERSRRRCLLCGREFDGRAFLCRPCADGYRHGPIPVEVRRAFYEALDRTYPDWSNTYGQYNAPRALLERLNAYPRSTRLVELGAGGGFTLERLSSMGFTRLIGVDLTATTVRAMRQRVPDVPVVTADVSYLPFASGSVDLLVASDVIEHLPDLDQHLAEVARVLRPGGAYLLKTPNRVLAEVYYRLRGLYDARFWHPSMRSATELARDLERHGLTPEFLASPALTDAQLRKIPIAVVRLAAAHVPLGRLPVRWHPHLEVVAVRSH